MSSQFEFDLVGTGLYWVGADFRFQLSEYTVVRVKPPPTTTKTTTHKRRTKTRGSSSNFFSKQLIGVEKEGKKSRRPSIPPAFCLSSASFLVQRSNRSPTTILFIPPFFSYLTCLFSSSPLLKQHPPESIHPETTIVYTKPCPFGKS